MMTEPTPSKIKQILNGAIKAISTSPEKYVKQPGIDFTRNRKLSFETMIKMLVGMGGNTICKELYDWFEYATDITSTSAFVQQRDEVLPQATEDLFHLFVDRSNYDKRYCGYRLLAADGSDLQLPENAKESFGIITKTVLPNSEEFDAQITITLMTLS